MMRENHKNAYQDSRSYKHKIDANGNIGTSNNSGNCAECQPNDKNQTLR